MCPCTVRTEEGACRAALFVLVFMFVCCVVLFLGTSTHVRVPYHLHATHTHILPPPTPNPQHTVYLDETKVVPKNATVLVKRVAAPRGSVGLLARLKANTPLTPQNMYVGMCMMGSGGGRRTCMYVFMGGGVGRRAGLSLCVYVCAARRAPCLFREGSVRRVRAGGGGGGRWRQQEGRQQEQRLRRGLLCLVLWVDGGRGVGSSTKRALVYMPVCAERRGVNVCMYKHVYLYIWVVYTPHQTKTNNFCLGWQLLLLLPAPPHRFGFPASVRQAVDRVTGQCTLAATPPPFIHPSIHPLFTIKPPTPPHPKPPPNHTT